VKLVQSDSWKKLAKFMLSAL